MNLAKKYLASLVIVFLFSITLSFFPVIGVLGYEYSSLSALLLSFISVFISVEVVNNSYYKRVFNANTNEFVASSILVNFSFLFVNFIVGLISSFYKRDCSIESGIAFYLLITLITVFFSTSIGVLTGILFKRRGFIIGSAVLFFIIIYSLWSFYSQFHIFFYNAIIGYFPGSLYDKSISITQSLIIYRGIILLWSLLIFTMVLIIKSLIKGRLNVFLAFAFLFMLSVLTFSYFKQEELGFSYTREYIKKSFLSGTHETEHFVIHYAPGSIAAEEIELIADDHEWRYLEVSTHLNVDLNSKVNSYIYPNKESRKKYFGSLQAAFANPIHKEMHQVYGSFPMPSLRHELVHIISSEFGSGLIKVSPEKGLIEGIAVAVDWQASKTNRHQNAKFLLEKEKLNNNLKDFLGFKFWYYPQSVSYTLMGSYCRYLIDKYGIEEFKEYYRTGYTNVYGQTVDQLIDGWVKFLRDDIEFSENSKEFLEHKFSEESVFEDACPRKTEEFILKGIKKYKGKDFAGAAVIFNKTHSLNNNNSKVKTLLAYSYYYSEDYDELLNMDTTRKLTELDKNIINNLKTNAMWTQKGYDHAYPYFKELIDKALTDSTKEEVALKVDLRRFKGDIKRLFNGYLLADNYFDRFVIMKDINEKYRSYFPAYYILGKMYLERRDYERAASNFEFANARSDKLPSPEIRLESLKLLGISQYSSGDYYGAIRTFTKLAKLDPGRYRNYSHNFIERSMWAVKNHQE